MWNQTSGTQPDRDASTANKSSLSCYKIVCKIYLKHEVCFEENLLQTFELAVTFTLFGIILKSYQFIDWLQWLIHKNLTNRSFLRFKNLRGMYRQTGRSRGWQTNQKQTVTPSSSHGESIKILGFFFSNLKVYLLVFIGNLLLECWILFQNIQA